MSERSPTANALERWINQRFLDRLVSAVPGRAFLLSLMVEAEEADEAGVFDNLLARVDDPELHKLVRIHRDDETRHAGLLRGCLARLGEAVERIPDALRILPILDRNLGGFAERFVAGEKSVMEAYVLLQVLEERAVYQFPFMVRALERVDAESAAVVAGITRDEARHVKYARAISKRYTSDEKTLARTVRHFREVEAISIAEQGRAFLRVVLDRDLLDASAPERFFWRRLASFDESQPLAPKFTSFAEARGGSTAS